ncbi:MAG: molybdopterin-dependent oxidoreductase, partial [Oscillospiraceae bacterium]|nr:molybdopterin-dependent oxidoreductase [Oscillospiraceae bacterium]
EGVAAVLTAADVPGDPIAGWLHGDWPVLVGVGEEVQFAGDVVALVAAENETLARAAAAAVAVDYEPLPPVLTMDASLAPDAPQLHSEGNVFKEVLIHRGDMAAAKAATAYEVHEVYDTPFAEHGFLETEAALALPQGERLVIRSADQAIFLTRKMVAKVLAVPEESILVEGYPVGGAFGGREDVLVQAQAALLAKATDRAVFLQYNREESHLIHAKKHPMRIAVSSGCDREGNLTYLNIDLLADKGAHASLGGPVLERACSMAPGPYRYRAVDVRGRSVYTNNPPTGGYRGFGITQSCFGVETNLTLLAEKAGISPWEIRYRNAVVPGEELYNGQIADESTAVRETLLAVKDIYESSPRAGIAVGMKNCGSGSGIPDVGRCTLRVHHGHVWLHSAAGMCGQGVETILPQMAASASGLDPKHFRWAAQDTDTTFDTGAAAASRLTVLAGEATRLAALQLREKIDALNLPVEEALDALEGEGFCGEYAAVTDAPSDEAGAHPTVHVAYGYATHVALLDESGHVKTIAAAHDVGRAIHPGNVIGQIEGGVVMSFGYALSEHFDMTNGIPPRTFGAVGFPRAAASPHVEAIIVEKSPLELALGAKGLGELVCIPTPAAIAGAYRAFDGKLRTKLPLEDTPYQKK